jgi:hypothetical protein
MAFWLNSVDMPDTRTQHAIFEDVFDMPCKPSISMCGYVSGKTLASQNQNPDVDALVARFEAELSMHPSCQVCFRIQGLNTHLVYKYIHSLLEVFWYMHTPNDIAILINSYIIDTDDVEASLCEACYAVIMSKETKPKNALRKRQLQTSDSEQHTKRDHGG